LVTFFFTLPVISISSTSSSDVPSKRPKVPHPDYSPLGGPVKHNHQYRRRTDIKDADHKPAKSKTPPKDDKIVNGHIKHEHHVKTSDDARNSIEVLENIFCASTRCDFNTKN